MSSTFYDNRQMQVSLRKYSTANRLMFLSNVTIFKTATFNFSEISRGRALFSILLNKENGKHR